MGLDLVELVLEVENRFGVTIPDEEAQKITTPRKLIDWLGDKKVLPSPKPGAADLRHPSIVSAKPFLEW